MTAGRDLWDAWLTSGLTELDRCANRRPVCMAATRLAPETGFNGC